jgi:hypothetical protein
MTSTLATTRPAPPPLEPVTPDCSLCGATVELIDDYFTCTGCEALWPTRTCHREPGTWHDAQAEQCRSIFAPWAGDPRPFLATKAYRCLLGRHHDDRHRSGDGMDWDTCDQTSLAEPAGTGVRR